MMGIRWEALKLWLKGAWFDNTPPAPYPVGFSNQGSRLAPGEQARHAARVECAAHPERGLEGGK